jgi:hypothetical protein
VLSPKAIVVKLLKPIARLLMKLEVSHSEFSELSKKAYVEAAFEHFGIPGKKLTVSRVSVLTGLSRKEVVRLYNDQSNSPEPKIKPNRSARVVTGWLSDAEFLSKEDNPRVLPLQGENSFATLVKRYSGDITAGAILDELLNAGVVRRLDGKMLQLEKKGYIPDADEVELASTLLLCTRDLLNTGAFNITKTEQQNARFQRQLSHFNVPQEIADEFSALCHEKSLALLLEMNEWMKAQRRQADDSLSNTLVSRIGLGLYYLEDEHEEDI